MRQQSAFRSYLYVPGSEPSKIQKALSGPADAVVVDLEDSVAPDRKLEARANASRLLDATLPKPVFVRVNPLQGPLGELDLRAVAKAGLAGVRLPKAESPDLVRRCCQVLEEELGEGPWSVVPIVESALGVELSFEMARASGLVSALAMGEADLSADLGVRSEEGLGYARSRCVNAARAAGVVAVQSVYVRLGDPEGLRTSCEAGRALGFSGRSAIHPSQLEVINEVFTPSEAEQKWARSVVEAFERVRAGGGGAALDPAVGFVDEAVVRSARTLLALAELGRSSR